MAPGQSLFEFAIPLAQHVDDVLASVWIAVDLRNDRRGVGRYGTEQVARWLEGLRAFGEEEACEWRRRATVSQPQSGAEVAIRLCAIHYGLMAACWHDALECPHVLLVVDSSVLVR